MASERERFGAFLFSLGLRPCADTASSTSENLQKTEPIRSTSTPNPPASTLTSRPSAPSSPRTLSQRFVTGALYFFGADYSAQGIDALIINLASVQQGLSDLTNPTHGAGAGGSGMTPMHAMWDQPDASMGMGIGGDPTGGAGAAYPSYGASPHAGAMGYGGNGGMSPWVGPTGGTTPYGVGAVGGSGGGNEDEW